MKTILIILVLTSFTSCASRCKETAEHKCPANNEHINHADAYPTQLH